LKSVFKNISQKWSLYWDDVLPATFGSLPWRSRSFKVRFRNNFTEMITILRRHVTFKIWAATLKVMSQHDLSTKSCPAHILVIWSQILQLFYISNHHIDTTVARTRTLLFEVWFYNYFWQTTSLSPIPIRGALPGSDRLLSLTKTEERLKNLSKKLHRVYSR